MCFLWAFISSGAQLMKIGTIKEPGGIFRPATQEDCDKATKFKNGMYYEIEIKMSRNPSFHRKVMSFFRFCFEHWKSDKEFIDEAGQFEVFRKQMTCVAGYYNEYFKFDGTVRIEAKSLAFGNMDEDEFRECYSALINAALKYIFKGTDDPQINNRLLGFF
jgi:hypothetical protein